MDPEPQAVVTVVLLHTDDDAQAQETRAALARCAWPQPEQLVTVVDASSDIPFQTSRSGWRVLEADPAISLAEARNIGGRSATTPFVAFVASGAVPPRDWLTRSIDVLRSDQSIAAVGPAVAGAGLPSVTFTGAPAHGRVRGRAGHQALFAPSDAMVVRADVFRQVGGFDQQLGRFGEDVDFGWRLWLLGWTVHPLPEVVVRPPRTPAFGVGAHERRYLEERNALRTIFTCYDDDNLRVALPAAMALATRRGELDGEAMLRAAGRAIADFTDALPELTETRAALQAARQRRDDELLTLFNAVLQPPDDPVLAASHAAILEAFGVSDRFGRRRRILVVTPDVLMARMAGPAIRAWEMSTALAREHDVQLVTVAGFCEVTSDAFGVRAVNDAELLELERWCDVLVIQGFILHNHPKLRESTKVLVVDMYDPMHLEHLELGREEEPRRRRQTLELTTAVMNDQLLRGDFFMCASAKQRDFWLGHLASLRRINTYTYDEDETLDSLIS